MNSYVSYNIQIKKSYYYDYPGLKIYYPMSQNLLHEHNQVKRDERKGN